MTTFKSFNSTCFPETFVIEQAAEVVAKVDRAQGHLHGEHQEKVCRQHRLHLQPANQTHRRQRRRQRHEARVGRIYGRQLRLCSRTVGPVSENHVEWRRGAIHEPAQEHHRNGPLPHQLGGQPEGGQNPNRQPSIGLGGRLHLCRDQGLSGPVHVQLLQQLGLEHQHHGQRSAAPANAAARTGSDTTTVQEASVPWPPAAAQNGWPSTVSVSFGDQIQYIIDRDLLSSSTVQDALQRLRLRLIG